MQLSKELINKIIIEENIKTMFQPIVSVRKKAITGVEALSRGIADTVLIPPDLLFGSAEKFDVTEKIDNICKKKAIQNFASTFTDSRLLFLNIDVSGLDKGALGISNTTLGISSLIRYTKEACIKHENIVIEILESKINNMEKLLEIISILRSRGFLIAIDDFGSGYSNFDRLSLIKPDIVKIDRSLVKDIDKCNYKQEIFKSITGLARKIGSIIVAEGIETKEEAFKCIELRADLLQGFYFAKPAEIISDSILPLINKISSEFKNYLECKLNFKKNITDIFASTVFEIKDLLLFASDTNLELYKIVTLYPFIESIYLLDFSGRQISDTVLSPNTKPRYKSELFSPAKKNADHSLKQYYYKIKTGETEFHITEPYISGATGNCCITISTFLNNEYIICIDTPADCESLETFENVV